MGYNSRIHWANLYTYFDDNESIWKYQTCTLIERCWKLIIQGFGWSFEHVFKWVDGWGIVQSLISKELNLLWTVVIGSSCTPMRNPQLYQKFNQDINTRLGHWLVWKTMFAVDKLEWESIYLHPLYLKLLY